jgi:dolichol-phosphate hexosyltransferase
MKLSILMPVFNERATLESAVKRVLDVGYPVDVELVIVDDGSVDGTRGLYPQWEGDPRVNVHLKPTNGGKGSAIRKGAELATGDYVIMCDADLEYAPEEIPSLLEPVLNGEATVVYGTRTFGSHNAFSYLYVLGNRAVTTAANVLFNCYIREAGKKLTWRDGVEALVILLRQCGRPPMARLPQIHVLEYWYHFALRAPRQLR